MLYVGSEASSGETQPTLSVTKPRPIAGKPPAALTFTGSFFSVHVRPPSMVFANVAGPSAESCTAT